MADFEGLIQDIKQNVVGLMDKIDDSETKVSKVVDQLEKAQEYQKEHNDRITDFETRLSDSEKENRKLTKALQRIEAVKSGVRPGRMSERNAEILGHFVRAISTPKMHGSNRSQEWLENEGVEVRAMTEGVSSAGGFMVPTVTVPELIRLVENYGVYRADARNVPLGTADTQWPKRSGGLTVYVPGEATAITASDLTISQVNLAPKELTTLTQVSRQLDEDSVVSVGQIIGEEIAQAFALAEDQAGFLGDGTSTYWGFVGITGALAGVSGGAKGIEAGAGNLWSELTDTDFQNLMGNTPNYADVGDQLRFYCHRAFYFAVCIRLAIAAGGTNATEYLRVPGTNQRAFHGYPVRFTQAMSGTEANSQHAVFLGNLQQAAYLGVRRDIGVESDSSRYFDQSLVAIKGSERVAINVHDVGTSTVAGAVGSIQTAAS